MFAFFRYSPGSTAKPQASHLQPAAVLEDECRDEQVRLRQGVPPLHQGGQWICLFFIASYLDNNAIYLALKTFIRLQINAVLIKHIFK